MLHVRLPLRHPRAPRRRARALHRRQPEAPGQPGRDLRQGLVRHHAALLARAPDQAADSRRRARRARVPRDRMGRGARARGEVARRYPRTRSGPARVLHRPRPEPGTDRLVGAAVRHDQLRGARRVLLGQHGRGGHVHVRRQLLGVRRARLGVDEVPDALGRCGGPRLQSDQARTRPAQGARREDRRGQSRAQWLRRDRGRMGAGQPGHRWPARGRADPRTAAQRPRRPRLPRALHECAPSRRAGARRRRRRDDRARRGRPCTVRDASNPSTRRCP